MRNVPYSNENDLSPNGLRELANKIRAILTHKVTKYVLIIIGTIFSIFFIIEFTKAFLIFFPLPLIQKGFLRFLLMPSIYLTFAIYIGFTIFIVATAFSSEPIATSSKYSA